MPEQEPLYFKKFREYVEVKFDAVDAKFAIIDKRFDEIEKKIETEIDSLAVITAKNFAHLEGKIDRLDGRVDNLENRMSTMENDVHGIKESIGKIEGHIGRYEIRAQNIEQILFHDYKPRLFELEKTVFA